MRSIILVTMILCACGQTVGYPTDFDTETDIIQDGGVDTDCSDDGICSDPPDDFCSEDGTQFISYTGEATCVDGECIYTTEVVDCTEDEYDGNCVFNISANNFQCNDPCVNYDCSYLENPTCDQGVQLVSSTNPYCMVETNNEPHCTSAMEDLTIVDCPNGCVEVEDGDDYCAE